MESQCGESISAKIGAERKSKLKKIADTKFNGSLTAAIIFAIDAMTEDETRERASIPASVLEEIQYIRLITNTGNSASDWNIIKQEVENLWQNTQSSSSSITKMPM